MSIILFTLFTRFEESYALTNHGLKLFAHAHRPDSLS